MMSPLSVASSSRRAALRRRDLRRGVAGPPVRRGQRVYRGDAARSSPAIRSSCRRRASSPARRPRPTSGYDEDRRADVRVGARPLQGRQVACRRCRSTGTTAARHESLITFSNYRFYDGELITYPERRARGARRRRRAHPSPTASTAGRQARDNPVEAAKVVERVLHHRAATQPGPRARRRRVQPGAGAIIEDELEAQLRGQDPTLADCSQGDRLDGFFVKNLENVQGDERDIIIFSDRLRPRRDGKLTLHFGPLNRDGGERRLNVADHPRAAPRRGRLLVRARAARPGRATRGRPPPAQLPRLRRRGRRAGAGDALDESPATPRARSRRRCSRDGAQWGYDVAPRRSACRWLPDRPRGRHPDRPGQLRPRHRVRRRDVPRPAGRARPRPAPPGGARRPRLAAPPDLGTSWYRDAEGETRRLAEAIERALLDAPVIAAPLAVTPPPIEVDFEEVAFDAPPPWAEPYSVAVLPAGRAFDMTEDVALAEVRQLVLHTVAEEAPIVDDLLARRVVGAWGSVVSDKRRRAVLRAVDGLVAAGTLVCGAATRCACPRSRMTSCEFRGKTQGPAHAARGKARARRRARRGAAAADRRRAARHRRGGRSRRPRGCSGGRDRVRRSRPR